MFWLNLLRGLWVADSVSTPCNRDSLKTATDKYILAQNSGRADVLTVLTSNLTYTENDVPVKINCGMLSQPLKLDHHFSIYDTTHCATFTELIAATTEHQYVIGTRMLFTADKISLIESIITEKGDWGFNDTGGATGYLHWTLRETWDPIPKAQQDSRETIKAAGDAYLDRLGDVDVSVPWNSKCARLEGGGYTDPNNAGGNTCQNGLPSTVKVTDRRYVIDEEMGVVDIFLGFPKLDRSAPQVPLPDSHLFRVEEGLIRYIHTLSACVNPGCGIS
ncbi:hypothetical protein F5Y04DRAFT_284315 [Hypomontagnella monticulosa]|nr:hypothetical protein F5Y04DRAFT_284315 [Hypomontagnella monticulosa]